MTKEEFMYKIDAEYLLWKDRFSDDLKHYETYLKLMSKLYDYIIPDKKYHFILRYYNKDVCNSETQEQYKLALHKLSERVLSGIERHPIIINNKKPKLIKIYSKDQKEINFLFEYEPQNIEEILGDDDFLSMDRCNNLISFITEDLK